MQFIKVGKIAVRAPVGPHRAREYNVAAACNDYLKILAFQVLAGESPGPLAVAWQEPNLVDPQVHRSSGGHSGQDHGQQQEKRAGYHLLSPGCLT